MEGKKLVIAHINVPFYNQCGSGKYEDFIPPSTIVELCSIREREVPDIIQDISLLLVKMSEGEELGDECFIGK